MLAWKCCMQLDPVLTIAVRLRLLRAAWGVSQQELAAKSGLSRGVVSLIENGNDHTIKVSTLRSLSTAMHVPMTTWFAGDSEWLAWYNDYRSNAHPQLGSCAL